jgi:hypothetical protein
MSACEVCGGHRFRDFQGRELKGSGSRKKAHMGCVWVIRAYARDRGPTTFIKAFYESVLLKYFMKRVKKSKGLPPLTTIPL